MFDRHIGLCPSEEFPIPLQPLNTGAVVKRPPLWQRLLLPVVGCSYQVSQISSGLRTTVGGRRGATTSSARQATAGEAAAWKASTRKAAIELSAIWLDATWGSKLA